MSRVFEFRYSPDDLGDRFDLLGDDQGPIEVGDCIVTSIGGCLRSFQVDLKDQERIVFGSDEPQTPSLQIRYENPEYFDAFEADHLADLADLLTAARIGGLDEDVFWIDRGTGDVMWVLGARPSPEITLAWLVRRSSVTGREIETLYGNYFRNPQRFPGGPIGYARRTFDALRRALELPKCFPPFWSGDVDAMGRWLTVRVPRNLRWAILIPFDGFRAPEAVSESRSYEEVRWIVTNKTFLQNSIETRSDAEVFADPQKFLSNAVFVVNDYNFWPLRARVKIEKVVSILKDAFAWLEGLGLSDLVLRYYHNPSGEDVLAILRDRRTRYFFANFHVDEGRWQVGGQGPTDNKAFVRIESLRPRDLCHVRRMRVFHCQSIGFEGLVQGGGGLADLLLDRGAQRVDANPWRDDFFDFAEHVLRLIWGQMRNLKRRLEMTNLLTYHAIELSILEFLASRLVEKGETF